MDVGLFGIIKRKILFELRKYNELRISAKIPTEFFKNIFFDFQFAENLPSFSILNSQFWINTGGFMKKSTIYSIASLIVVLLVLNTLSRKTKIYEKEINFTTPEQAISNFIGYANAYERLGNKDTYINVVPAEFLESLSRRYRLFIKDNNDARFINTYIPTFYSYELEEIDSDTIKLQFEGTLQRIPNYKRAKTVKFYRLDGNSDRSKEIVDMAQVKDNGTVSSTESYNSDEEAEKTSLYLVVVDEGEGFVVDYYTEISLNEG